MATCAECDAEIERCVVGSHWHHVAPPKTPHFPTLKWWEEPAIRASGEVICEVCGKPYWRHEQVAKAEVPTLVRACDGRLLKL